MKRRLPVAGHVRYNRFVAFRVDCDAASADYLLTHLKSQGFFFRVAQLGVVYIPSNQYYGDARDILAQIHPGVPANARIAITEEEDPDPDAIYHR